MTRPIKEIIAQLRRDANNSSVAMTLIQTHDVLALCDATEGLAENLQDALDNYIATECNIRQVSPDEVRQDSGIQGWISALARITDNLTA